MKKEISKILGVGLALALAVSLVLMAAPVVASTYGTLTKTITLHDDGSLITCSNPMSGIVDFEFDYTSPVGVTNAESLLLAVTAPKPYTTNPINMLFYFPGGVPYWDPGSEKAMMEMGIVDWDGDGTIQDDCVLVYTPGDGTTGCSFTITFSLDTTKNWSMDTDECVALGYTGIHPDWNRPAGTSVWPMGPCCPLADPPYPDGKYNISSMVYDGGTTLLFEPLVQDEPLYNEPYMEPSVAYDVKGAVQRFVAKNTGPHAIVKAWKVFEGLGDPTIDIVVVDGGGIGEDWIDIQAVVVGDGTVKAYIDTDQDGDVDIELQGEKKWGEIAYTELEISPTVTDTYQVDEYVYAEFLISGGTEILPAKDAWVSWWLLDIDALADLEAIAPDGEACGTWLSDTWPWGTGEDPFIQLEDLWDTYQPADPATTHFIEPRYINPAPFPAGDPTKLILHELTHQLGNATMTDVNGLAYTNVYAETPGSWIVVTLTEYPVDKNGENIECVQWDTWYVPPPPVIEKLPDIVWAGEKDVIEWRLEPEYEDYLVAFYLEDPSVGTFETTGIYPGLEFPYLGFAIKDSAWAVVAVEECDEGAPEYGVARVILHSDKQGKSNVVAVLLDVDFDDIGPETTLAPLAQQGFIIYFLAFEEVEVVNMGDDPTNDEAWLNEGKDVDELGVNESSLLRLRVKGFFEDPVMKSPRPEKPQDINGDGITDIILPKGRWILPDDYPTLAFGKLMWDLMDTPIDDIVSWLDEDGDQVETLGDYGEPACWEYPPFGDIVAQWDVIGPFSKLEPVNEDGTSWDVTQQPAVPADGNEIDEFGFASFCRTTVVPDGLMTPEDANMPPAEILFAVTDGSGILAQVNKANLYQIPEVCDTDTGVVYTNPYYWQEIPANPIIPPMFGSGLAGYEWDSWDTNVNIDGPYRFWDGLTVWTADEVNAMNIFGLTVVPETLKTYTDNHGEAWVEFTQKDFDSSTIKALATYPYQLGDHMTVVSNPVIKISENLKDIKIYVDDVMTDTTVDPIRKWLLVFVRDYDGTPAVCEEADWLIDGPYGVIEALLANTCGACTNDCYVDAGFDVDCTDCFITLDGRTAWNCTRLMTAAEIAYFVDEGVFTTATDADDYAITGLRILSSHKQNVDVKITIWDCWEGDVLPQFHDKMVTGFGDEVPPVFDPWVYDVDESGVIEKDEAVAAVNDYFAGDITKANAVEVLNLYFGA